VSKLSLVESNVPPTVRKLPLDESQFTIDESQFTIDESQFTIDESQFTIDESQLTIERSKRATSAGWLPEWLLLPPKLDECPEFRQLI
jgi:hypothetical protein